MHRMAKMRCYWMLKYAVRRHHYALNVTRTKIPTVQCGACNAFSLCFCNEWTSRPVRCSKQQRTRLKNTISSAPFRSSYFNFSFQDKIEIRMIVILLHGQNTAADGYRPTCAVAMVTRCENIVLSLVCSHVWVIWTSGSVGFMKIHFSIVIVIILYVFIIRNGVPNKNWYYSCIYDKFKIILNLRNYIYY